MSLSKVDAYEKEHSITPSEYDREAIEAMAQSLGAEIAIWGSVNQYTPYKFDRLAPATPPYVELTIYGLRAGQSSVAKVGGRKQGGLPGTIWSRQPTFEDVAQPLVQELLATLR